MNCSNCGKPLAPETRFCTACGAPVPPPPAGAPVKKKARKKINPVTLLMALIILAMAAYIAIDKMLPQRIAYGDMVDAALPALSQEWREVYASSPIGNGHLEIVHTRVIKIRPNAPGNTLQQWYSERTGKEIAYLVEFTLFSDYLGTAPYYENVGTRYTVVIHTDGTSDVLDVLKHFRSTTYQTDFSFIEEIVDLGTAYNQVWQLK